MRTRRFRIHITNGVLPREDIVAEVWLSPELAAKFGSYNCLRAYSQENELWLEGEHGYRAYAKELWEMDDLGVWRRVRLPVPAKNSMLYIDPGLPSVSMLEVWP